MSEHLLVMLQELREDLREHRREALESSREFNAKLDSLQVKIESLNESRWKTLGKSSAVHFLVGIAVQVAIALIAAKGLS